MLDPAKSCAFANEFYEAIRDVLPADARLGIVGRGVSGTTAAMVAAVALWQRAKAAPSPAGRRRRKQGDGNVIPPSFASLSELPRGN